MAEQGRLFVMLQKEPNPKRDYYPDIALSKLAAAGARVSSKAISCCWTAPSSNGPSPVRRQRPCAEGGRRRPAGRCAVLPGRRRGMARRKPAKPSLRPGRSRCSAVFWPMKSAVVLLSGVAILLGLLAATWAGR